MSEYIQSFHAFLPGKFMRWILYLFYPAALFLIYIFSGFFVGRYLVGMVMPVMLAACEMAIDMYVFGGFGTRDNAGHIEFLRASVRGRDMIKRALIFDALRRVLYIVVVSVCCYVDYCIEMGERTDLIAVWGYLCMAASASLAGSIGLWLIRFVDNRTMQFGAIYITICLLTVAMVFFFQFTSYSTNRTFSMQLLFFGMAICYIISVITQICMLVKRVKEGYYDNKNEKNY